VTQQLILRVIQYSPIRKYIEILVKLATFHVKLLLL